MELIIIVGIFVIGLALERIFPPTEREREVLRRVKEERARRLVEEWQSRCDSAALMVNVSEPSVYLVPPDAHPWLGQHNQERRSHRHARQARVEKNPKTPAVPPRPPAGN